MGQALRSGARQRGWPAQPAVLGDDFVGSHGWWRWARWNTRYPPMPSLVAAPSGYTWIAWRRPASKASGRARRGHDDHDEDEEHGGDHAEAKAPAPRTCTRAAGPHRSPMAAAAGLREINAWSASAGGLARVRIGPSRQSDRGRESIRCRPRARPDRCAGRSASSR